MWDFVKAVLIKTLAGVLALLILVGPAVGVVVGVIALIKMINSVVAGVAALILGGVFYVAFLSELVDRFGG